MNGPTLWRTVESPRYRADPESGWPERALSFSADDIRLIPLIIWSAYRFAPVAKLHEFEIFASSSRRSGPRRPQRPGLLVAAPQRRSARLDQPGRRQNRSFCRRLDGSGRTDCGRSRASRDHGVDRGRAGGWRIAGAPVGQLTFAESGDVDAADVDAPSDGARTPGSREADPAISCEQADLAERLRTLLADLPAPQRETIDLWCEGLCYREIAEITGRQEGHIRVLAHRGLTALRTHPLVRDLLTPAGLQSAQTISAS